MTAQRQTIAAVPTNVITGFLGVGKTTAILNLIRQRPAGERWAVLVNEFGEIGIDGGLLSGGAGGDTDIFVEEVPGGCMCCTSGLPMQIALNRLLITSQPDRLLIEPTGLGHPREVLQTLSQSHNREVLSLGRTLTLVDARHVSDPRYATNATFLQQLEIADLVVANKADLCGPSDRDALTAFVNTHCHRDAELLFSERGQIDVGQLKGSPLRELESSSHHHHAETVPELASERPFPSAGVVTAVNEGEGFRSVGWRFSPDHVFIRERLFDFFRTLSVERMKAVFITQQGVFAYNLTRDALQEVELDDCSESRIEIISDRTEAAWGDQLLACAE